MALAFDTTLRNTRLDAIDDELNAGAGAALLRIYDGSRPATCGTATTLLAQLTFSDPAFGAASAGAMTGNSITDDSSADNTGTATWFRVVDSDTNCVLDGNVGTAGSDLNFNSVSFQSGATVSVTQFDITEGNP